MSFICATCGQAHEGLPLDIAFAKPPDYFVVPENQRAGRCQVTADWCVIDGRRYFLRGCLLVPLRGAAESFTWGIWAEVSPTAFRRYYELRDADARSEPPCPGTLSGEAKGYEGLDGHPVSIQFGTAAERPRFTLRPSQHRLYREQTEGITQHRVYEILHANFPQAFP